MHKLKEIPEFLFIMFLILLLPFIGFMVYAEEFVKTVARRNK